MSKDKRRRKHTLSLMEVPIVHLSLKHIAHKISSTVSVDGTLKYYKIYSPKLGFARNVSSYLNSLKQLSLAALSSNSLQSLMFDINFVETAKAYLLFFLYKAFIGSCCVPMISCSVDLSTLWHWERSAFIDLSLFTPYRIFWNMHGNF